MGSNFAGTKPNLGTKMLLNLRIICDLSEVERNVRASQINMLLKTHLDKSLGGSVG